MLRWRELDMSCLDQVANANDSTVDLTPASEAPAQAIRDGWAAWAVGQDIPLIWEKRRDYAEPCEYI